MKKMAMIFAVALFATSAAVLLIKPAAAQSLDGLQSTTAPKDPALEAKRKEIDNDYRKALNTIPDAKGSNDPWGNVRQAPSSTKAPKR